MKRFSLIIASSILLLFFIQSAGTLVESIYILDLMHTTLDAKVLGLLFFFTPVLLLPFAKRIPVLLTWITFAVLFISRSLLPYLNTADRMLAAGFATGSSLGLFLLLFYATPKGTQRSDPSRWGTSALALALGLSVLVRTAGHGIEASLTRGGGWIGLLLGLLLGGVLALLDFPASPAGVKKPVGVTSAVLGMFLVLILVYFAFSAPAVIARWSEGNYTLIVLAVSLLAAGCLLVGLFRPALFQRIGRRLLLVWNLAFTLCLTGTLLAHSVAFPAAPGSPAVTVAASAWWQAIPLVFMLLLFPVLFIDFGLFLERIVRAVPAPRSLVPGLLLGCLALILLVFTNIFTNVWGYIQPVSLFFRGKYWLPFLLPAAGLCFLVWGPKNASSLKGNGSSGKPHWAWGGIPAGIFLVTVLAAFPAKPIQADRPGRTSLTVMTYNIQAANDSSAEKSFDRQLALIHRVSPDILALQETDTARISLNNNDYVRYYADRLGYYSYYGPTTVAGTYGTAILSKFPLVNTRSVYTFSDTDEIGVAEAQVQVGGKIFSIYDVHPDGSDTAKLAFARELIERSSHDPYAVILGDFNLRDTEAAYQLINSIYTNAWISVYPGKVSPDGVDMSGRNRIDHIFLSHSLQARNPFYLLPPASGTDHPVHWAEITWGNP
jgi:endonuclease/exonuclease/phosphatase family metal-dependent hydrolase